MKTLVVLTLLALPAVAAAQDSEWPQFRGPKRDGVSTDTGLLKQWPADGPKLLWEGKGAGRGYSSVAITGGRVYTIGDDQKDEYAVCFEEKTGKQVWKVKLGPSYNEHGDKEGWQSSRSTPTVDGKQLYCLTPHGELVALESAGGKEIWRKGLTGDLGGRKGDGWGYGESPLVDGDRVMVTPGGSKATMACLEKMTGKTVWTSAVPNDRGAGHGSIVTAEIGKVKVYVNTTAGGAFGVRAEDGKLLWNYPIEKTTAVIPTPIVRGDLVFFCAGYNRGGALLKQAPSTDGVSMQEVYGLKQEMNNKHGGVILVGDHLYGDSNDGGAPWCADLATGAQKWKGRGSGKGSASLTAADGHLYIRYSDGKMVLAKASPEAYTEVSSFKIPHSGGRPSWSHPVVAGQKLFLREGNFVLCYGLKGS